ncbi:hypothetical protein GCM10009841_27060 [Microlunatus panaciterrae]
MLRNDRVVARREHPELSRVLDRLVGGGHLLTVLPGVYTAPGTETDPLVRIAAAARWDPRAVIAGRAAARWSFWPELAVDRVEVLVRTDRRPRAGYRFCRESLPAELVCCWLGVLLTVPALTALDLVRDPAIGGGGIDRALLKSAATLQEMHDALALTPRRRGNPERALLLRDSRHLPWSEAERWAHRLLRAAGIDGWETNVPVVVDGLRYYLDIAFRLQRVAVEIDGFAFHGQRDQFERDRAKWSALVAAGWRVLHFTWRQLTDSPDWVVRVIHQTLNG